MDKDLLQAEKEMHRRVAMNEQRKLFIKTEASDIDSQSAFQTPLTARDSSPIPISS